MVVTAWTLLFKSLSLTNFQFALPCLSRGDLNIRRPIDHYAPKSSNKHLLFKSQLWSICLIFTIGHGLPQLEIDLTSSFLSFCLRGFSKGEVVLEEEEVLVAFEIGVGKKGSIFTREYNIQGRM
jgi:hypothetical protein